MKPSEQCKERGITLVEFSRLSDTSSKVLIAWHKAHPIRFACLLEGAIVKNRLKIREAHELRCRDNLNNEYDSPK